MVIQLSTTAKIMALLDVLLSLLIIVGSQKLLNTDFGKVSITFGILMLTIITILRIFRKW
ncbi:MAG TPA: hypothetical protein VJK51_04605 [Candidatus Nanoarchaeia archaeon]|nr:hypothetical protein [Candidatus Nanoarchaeia archaeon]